jgi:hypothetical protein
MIFLPTDDFNVAISQFIGSSKKQSKGFFALRQNPVFYYKSSQLV